jgi:DNA-binding CsgD family transcriptional regulator
VIGFLEQDLTALLDAVHDEACTPASLVDLLASTVPADAVGLWRVAADGRGRLSWAPSVTASSDPGCPACTGPGGRPGSRDVARVARGRRHALLVTVGPREDARFVWCRADRGFSDAEVLTLRLLRPHLEVAYRRWSTDDRRAAALTQRQRDVLALAAAGWSNADIADLLVISPGTVRKHLDNIYRALEVPNRTAAAAAAASVLGIG